MISFQSNEEIIIDRYIVRPIVVGGEVSGLLISGPRIKTIYVPLKGSVKIEKLPKKVKKYVMKTYGIEI
ncbi:MAG: hypothetical protein F7B60_06855 [Desulfurococcales archaeon]|nr:hypothetical protein [Desulfurococcales archaeon]